MPQESHERDIFAIAGLAPEVQAVAFAKYSRSQESVKTTIDELTDEKSAEFHEKWVLGYGDASVADMAVLAIALENVSMIASKAVEDFRLASYQEKSTRYVPFDPTRYHRPALFMTQTEHAHTYTHAIEDLMNGYTHILDRMKEYFRAKYTKPEDITDKAYEHKLRARSLDVARYVLPVSTLTNFGMIASAREIRYMISRLRASPFQEVREIAEEIQRAALERAYNPNVKKIEPLLLQLADHGVPQELIDELSASLRLTVKGAPTLIKFTEPREYHIKKDRLATIAGMFLDDEAPPYDEPRVDLVTATAPEDELIASILYPHSSLPFRSLVEQVRRVSHAQRAELLTAINEHRTSFDNLPREFEVGTYFIFDTLMDYGAFRDLQRHRLTSQLHQTLSPAHGFEVPRDLADAGLLTFYEELMGRNAATFETLAAANVDEARYVLAMAWRKRTLFKMNVRELYHVVELRSRIGGHFSYRTLVYDMYELLRRHHPLLAQHLRAIKMDFDADFFGR